MSDLFPFFGAYAIGTWIAAVIVAARWFGNQTTTIGGFLTLSGWAAVATVSAAIAVAVA